MKRWAVFFLACCIGGSPCVSAEVSGAGTGLLNGSPPEIIGTELLSGSPPEIIGTEPLGGADPEIIEPETADPEIIEPESGSEGGPEIIETEPLGGADPVIIEPEAESDGASGLFETEAESGSGPELFETERAREASADLGAVSELAAGLGVWSVSDKRDGDGSWDGDRWTSRDGSLWVEIDEGEASILIGASGESVSVPDGTGRQSFLASLGLQNFPARSLIIGEGVGRIGRYAFRGGAWIEEVSLPESLREVDDAAFSSCKSVREVRIPEGVRRIGASAFSYDRGMEKVTIPDGTGEIGMYAFSGCAALTHVSLPGSLEVIEYGVFLNCPRLEQVSIPEGVSEIWDGAFQGCSSLKTAELPAAVTVITERTFSGCVSLSQVTLHGNVTKIDRNAFLYCKSLRKVVTDAIDEEWAEAAIISTGNERLYQAQVVCRRSPLSIRKLTYGFANSAGAFGYSSGYRIPLAVYQRMFGVTAMADLLYLRDPVWRGSCYGMAGTSAMMNQPSSGITAKSFQSHARKVEHLVPADKGARLKLSVRRFIEDMQVSQFEGTIQQELSANMGQVSEAASLANQAQENDKPVIICLGNGDGGHAVAGFDLRRLDSGTYVIVVYDCNFPGRERYITLKGSPGHFTSWSYLFNDQVRLGSSVSGSWISYVPYDLVQNSWKNRGSLTSRRNLISVNSDQVEISDAGGHLVAEIKDGSLTSKENDIFQIREMNMAAAFDGQSLIYVPSGESFVLENRDGDLDEFKVSVASLDQSTAVTTQADQVGVKVLDSQGENEASVAASSGDGYQIEMRSKSGDAGYENAVLQGVLQGKDVQVKLSVNGGVAESSVQCGAALSVDGEVRFDNRSHAHDWDKGKVTIRPTVLKDGERTYICRRCGEKKTEKVPRLTPTIRVSRSNVTLTRKKARRRVWIGGLAAGDRVVKVSSSRKKIVKAVYEDGILTLKAGKKAGKAVVTIRLLSGKTAKIKVTVTGR